MMRCNYLGGLLAVALTAPALVAEERPSDEALVAAVEGEWRTEANRERDEYRNPVESLSFWGLEPGMTILEVQPGGAAWWTEILAPYARMTDGRYYATAADLEDPNLSDGARQGRERFAQRFADEDIYGEVNLVNWGSRSAPLPAETFDFILSARSVHGWMMNDMVEKAFRDLHDALRPGGILAVEQHRADPGTWDPDEFTGYLPEALVIAHAERAGLRFAGRSEVNANPEDTKDHPFGVWTLPPVRASSPLGSNEPPDPDFDRAHYDAIGESDRMTLRFVRPE